jgi:hypothetical protein
VSGVDIIPYALFAAVAAACLASILLIGAQAWVVPVVALPPAVAYIFYDRAARRREEHQGG